MLSKVFSTLFGGTLLSHVSWHAASVSQASIPTGRNLIVSDINLILGGHPVIQDSNVTGLDGGEMLRGFGPHEWWGLEPNLFPPDVPHRSVISLQTSRLYSLNNLSMYL